MTMPSDAAEGTAAIAVIVVGKMPCDSGGAAGAAGAADAASAAGATGKACTLAAMASCCPAGMALRAASKKFANIAALSS